MSDIDRAELCVATTWREPGRREPERRDHGMTTLITRDQMRPGQIVQHITTQTCRARSPRWSAGSKRAGLHKLDHLPLLDRDEWQTIRGRWRVRWRPPFSFLGAHIDGFWIAEEQDRRDADGDHEWRAFDTWAEAITYADRVARQAGTEVAP